MSKRPEKKRRGQRRQQKERRKRRGMSTAGKRGDGDGRKEGAKGGVGGSGGLLTGPARTHHPNQLESLIFPSHNTSPSISDVYNRRGEK